MLGILRKIYFIACTGIKMAEVIKLKDTLNLPKTNFPMQAQLVKREAERLKQWDDIHLYDLIQQKNAGHPRFMLHDGPPFTNGDVHIGTALNKILKDIILRYKSMQGFSTPYIPGWDCHGLPIEHKVSKEKPELLNQNPYQDGWLLKVEVLDPTELDTLMEYEDYKSEAN